MSDQGIHKKITLRSGWLGLVLCVFTLMMPYQGLARTAPVTPADIARVERDIVGGPWAAASNVADSKTVLYALHSATCPFCQLFMKQQINNLISVHGVDVRVLLYPRPADSLDETAWIAHERSLALIVDQMMHRPIDAPDAHSSSDLINAFNATRTAAVTASEIAENAGIVAGTPVFLYQTKSGRWMVSTGYTTASFETVRRDLGVPPLGK